LMNFRYNVMDKKVTILLVDDNKIIRKYIEYKQLSYIEM